MNAGKSSRGFTLVEVLVALVIMAVMAGMAWQGIDGIIRARDASQARLETALRLNTVIAQWDQDLASIQETDVVKPALICAGNAVRMTRRTTDGIQLVTWALRPAEDNTSVWERWASPSVKTQGELTDNFMRSQQLQGGEAGSIKTITGLTDWKIYFYQGNAWANCASSLDAAASSVAPTLPDGVRVVLTFAPGSGLSGDLTRDTLVLKR